MLCQLSRLLAFLLGLPRTRERNEEKLGGVENRMSTYNN